LAAVAVAVALLAFGHFVLDVRLEQPVALLLAVVCTAFCFSGIMMLVSTLGKTQSAVAGAGWGVLLPMAMGGGGMVPLMAMPDWMLTLSNVSPVKWGILALEGATWRGYSLAEMATPCGILLAVGAACFALGVRSLARQDA